MTTHRHPMPERDAASGQSTTEFLVLALVLVPLFLSLPLLGKYLDLTHATEQAARYVAFETAIQGPARPTPGAGTLASEVRQRFFSLPQAPILSRSGEASATAHAPNPRGPIIAAITCSTTRQAGSQSSSRHAKTAPRLSPCLPAPADWTCPRATNTPARSA